ncbi:MAG: nucleoside hydrolase [Myxococcota bacterium]
MSPVRVHIDTDPGLDDLLALAFALASPELSVEAITTVSGNASLEAVTENARRFMTLADAAIPIGAGAAGPLALSRIDATGFHGADGRRGVEIAEPAARAPLGSARELLRRSLGERGVERVIALGPLTNVAALVADEPELFANAEVVWMGGTLGSGNVTREAEFNAFADPRAVRVVLESGVRLRVVGLEVTERVALRAVDLNLAGARATARGRMLDGALRALFCAEHAFSGEPAAYLHDPCAVAASFAPGLFDFQRKRLLASDSEGRERGRLRVDRDAGHEVHYAVAARESALTALFLERVTEWASDARAAS